jgi:hypothetical protein
MLVLHRKLANESGGATLFAAGTVDNMSRYLSNIGSFLEYPPPLFSVFERTTFLLICNAYFIYNMSRKRKSLKEAKSFVRLMQIFSERTSFGEFLGCLWRDNSTWEELHVGASWTNVPTSTPAEQAAERLRGRL